MWQLSLEFVGHSSLIVVAGVFLVRYSDRLGDRLGLGRSLAGMLLLATATSLPELLIGCHAARIGAVDLAVGDLMGSSLCNLLILAVLDLATKTRGTMFSVTAATHAMAAVTSMLLTAIVLLFLLLDTKIGVGRLGVGSIAIGVGYLFCVRLVYYDQQHALRLAAPELESSREELPPLGSSLAGYLATTALIFYIAPKLAETSDQLAQLSGLGGTFFGTFFVALITSLPEAVTSLAALRIGAVDLAMGNIFGSNAFNMVMFIGLDLSYGRPILLAAADVHAVTATALILVTCVALLGMLYRVEKRLWILEPDAVLVILLIVGALGLVYYLGVPS